MKNNQFATILLIIAIFPLFYHLDFLPIRLFDESRLAVSALEMSHTNNFLVVHYKGEPEMWSVKPPFMIWCQAACILLFGAGEFALRFPSAIAGLITILMIFYFVRKSGGKPLFAFTCSLVLIASSGYITEHGTRSGDYDAMLVLFQICYASSYFLWLKFPVQTKFLTLTFVFVVLSVLTKGIAGFMLLPGLLIFTIYSRQLITVIRERKFWIGIILTISTITSFYILRETYNPGYLKKVYENEIFYRYFDVNEGHEGKWNFYLNYLIQTGYSSWYLFSLGGLLTIFLTKDILFRKLVAFAGINALTFILVISNSQTKIEWYALPLFPFLAILTGSVFWFLFHEISDKFKMQMVAVKLGVASLFLILFIQSYSLVVRNSIHPGELPGSENIYRLSYIFQSAVHGSENLDGIHYCYLQYNAHLHFYTEVLNTKGQHISLADPKELKPGNRVLIGNADVKEIIFSKYKTKLLKIWDNGAQLVLILQ